MKKMKEQHGITLVALVVTIVVLLILSGVTITNVISDDGIISKAEQAVNKTKRATIIENIAIDILTEQMDGGSITESKLEEILEQYGTVQYDDNDGSITGVLPDDLNEVIDIADLYSGTLATEQETISTTESYVGYYANLDSDPEPEGIIYADLLISGSGTWNDDSWGSYSYDAIASSKEYTISDTAYTEGPFPAKEIISVVNGSTGEDRFYVMALEDVNAGTSYCWYDAAYGLLDNTVSTTENDFGRGKEFTDYVMGKWNDATLPYGAHNDGSYDDIWGVIEDEYDAGWFVPSKSEWSAFGDTFSITSSNYGDFGLRSGYWSSSQNYTNTAYNADFGGGYIGLYDVKFGSCVRLSTTF